MSASVTDHTATERSRAAELAALLTRIAELTQSAQRLAGSLERPSYPPQRTADRPENYLERAQVLYAERRARARTFGDAARHFEEPAWDILLDLFIAYERGRLISVSSACGAACVPPTTGLRWLKLLERDGLVRCWPCEFDRRRRYVTLTETALGMMLAYLDRVSNSV